MVWGSFNSGGAHRRFGAVSCIGHAADALVDVSQTTATANPSGRIKHSARTKLDPPIELTHKRIPTSTSERVGFELCCDSTTRLPLRRSLYHSLLASLECVLSPRTYFVCSPYTNY